MFSKRAIGPLNSRAFGRPGSFTCKGQPYFSVCLRIDTTGLSAPVFAIHRPKPGYSSRIPTKADVTCRGLLSRAATTAYRPPPAGQYGPDQGMDSRFIHTVTSGQTVTTGGWSPPPGQLQRSVRRRAAVADGWPAAPPPSEGRGAAGRWEPLPLTPCARQRRHRQMRQ